jgi:hypothetical protein
MTSHPTPDNHHHWWLVTGRWDRLHAIPGTAITPEQMRTAIDDMQPLPARAACHLRREWQMPGIASRLVRTRCTACCHALGIPTGHGTPANNTRDNA